MPTKSTGKKTSIIGIIALALSVANIWVPDQYKEKLNITTQLVLGSGMLLAQDQQKKQ